MINIVFSYDPVGYLPYNYLLFTDTREPLVEVAAQVLCATLDSPSVMANGSLPSSPTIKYPQEETTNLFLSYLSRIHRDEVDCLFLLLLLLSAVLRSLLGF